MLGHLCLAFLFQLFILPVLLNAQTGEVPYSSRPDILKVESRPHVLGEGWQDLKRAQIAFVAELFELYADYDLYFLARDAELIADVARMAKSSSPEFKGRVTLLNVSRVNLEDAELKSYLEQEGFTLPSLFKRPALIIDTGLLGTIPEKIRSFFPRPVQSRIRTQFIVSETFGIPGNYLFATIMGKFSGQHLDREILEQYEHMAHFTGRSTRFVRVGTTLEPMSEECCDSDGKIDRHEALFRMEDLKYDWTEDGGADFFRKVRQLANAVLRLTRDNRTTLRQKAELFNISLLSADENIARSILMDALELQFVRGNRDANDLLNKISFRKTNEFDIIAGEHPEWSEVLNNLDPYLTDLVKAGDLPKIKKLIDARLSPAVANTIASKLFLSNYDDPRLDPLRHYFWSRASIAEVRWVVRFVFSGPQLRSFEPFLRQLIESAEDPLLTELINAINPRSNSNTRNLKNFSTYWDSLRFPEAIERRSYLLKRLGPAKTDFDSVSVCDSFLSSLRKSLTVNEPVNSDGQRF